MSDDVFDQLVDDILSGEDDEEVGAEAEEDDDAGSPGLDIDEDSVINGEDTGAEVPAVAIVTDEEEEDDDEPVASSESAVDPAPAASAETKKSAGKTSSLPLLTATTFAHPSYSIGQTLSLISARRVVGVTGVDPSEGRSKEGERLLGAIEQDLKTELRRLAGERGGHAVLGVQLSLTVAGGVLYAHAQGTPVRLRKRDQ